MEIIATALATTVKGHPVKVMWRRDQEFYNTYMRQQVVTKIKAGVKKDGTITAFEMANYWDAGPYAEYGANVVNASGLSATGPYRIPNVSIDSMCQLIHTVFIRIFLQQVLTEVLDILKCHFRLSRI
jgi:carbon-monoxide dehydrogenase large subunit